jgi:uncharacterized protein with GYD domain
MIASAIAVGLAMPATAQRSTTMYRYAVYHKYTDQAVKRMMDNAEDRAAVATKITEAFGGKAESLFFPDGR